MSPTPRYEGVLLAGFDPLSVDTVACQIMGFQPNLIRDIQRGLELNRYPLTDAALPLRIESNVAAWTPQISPGSDLKFRPHYAWVEYLQEVRHD